MGQLYERVTDVVRDNIYVTALALESTSGTKAVIASLEINYIPELLMTAAREKLRVAVPDLPPEALIMTATHVHTGPYLENNFPSALWGHRFKFISKDHEVLSPEVYMDFVAQKCAFAVAAAWTGRSSGGVALAFGRVAVPQSRFVSYKDGSTSIYGTTNVNNFLRIEGGADTGVEYIATFDAARVMTGVVINLACPAQVIEHQSYISADLWGEVRRLWPECPYILPLCGAAGDIAMRDLVRRDRSEQSMNTETGMNQQAGRILRETRHILSEIKPEDIWYDMPIKHKIRNISLPLRMVSEDEYYKAKTIYDTFERDYENNDYSQPYEDSIPLRMNDRMNYAMAAGVVNRYKLQQEVTAVDMEVHALRLGDAVLTTNPFELFQDYGMQIKARSPARQTLIAQLSCGHLGYLPTAIGVTGGSYSTGIYNGYVGLEGGHMLVEITLDTIEACFETTKQR